MTQIKREQITTEEKNKSRNEVGIRILIRKSFRLTRFISPLGPARPPGYNSLSSNKILINISQQNIGFRIISFGNSLDFPHYSPESLTLICAVPFLQVQAGIRISSRFKPAIWRSSSRGAGYRETTESVRSG